MCRIERRVERQQRDGAAEQHGEEIEGDRAEDDPRRADEADAFEEALEPGRLGADPNRDLGTGHAEQQQRRGDEEQDAGRVDRLGLEREEETAERRAARRRGLAAQSSAGRVLRREARRDELGCQRAPGGVPEGARRARGAASARNGQSWCAPASVTTSSRPTTIAASAKPGGRRDQAGEAIGKLPAGKASRSSGRNSASPIRPRSKALRWIAYTCQPTATETICVPKLEPSMPSHSRR